MGYRTVKLRPLSSCPVQCRRPHHQPGCLKTWKPPRCRKTMRWKAVYHTLCFHMTSKPPCFWTRRSWDMARGVTYLFSSDKLKSRTLLLPPVRPRPPPSAPRRPQTDACWGTRPTPAGTASARLPRLATTVVAVVGVAPCRPQRIRTVTTHTPAPRLGALPSPVLDPCPQPLQGGWLVCRSWSSQARTPQQTLLTSTGLVVSTTHPGNPGRRGAAQVCLFAPRRPCAAGSCR